MTIMSLTEECTLSEFVIQAGIKDEGFLIIQGYGMNDKQA